MAADDEIRPYLVYRNSGRQVECALWALDTGGKALALFLTADAADRYLDTAGLRPAWKSFRPGKAELLKILEHCLQVGVAYAVLEPDNDEARRLFDLGQVLAAARADEHAGG
ncbi:MAG TPA: hypothetical protein VHY20_07960 [Pirellulales bacterium]|jgi:hypothetical protein|nr:hypothetical protein [Pirellulales bacterium]